MTGNGDQPDAILSATLLCRLAIQCFLGPVLHLAGAAVLAIVSIVSGPLTESMPREGKYLRAIDVYKHMS